jgi:hypothetical protein
MTRDPADSAGASVNADESGRDFFKEFSMAPPRAGSVRFPKRKTGASLPEGAAQAVQPL